MTSGCVSEVCMSSDGPVTCPGCPVMSGIDRSTPGYIQQIESSWMEALPGLSVSWLQQTKM